MQEISRLLNFTAFRLVAGQERLVAQAEMKASFDGFTRIEIDSQVAKTIKDMTTSEEEKSRITRRKQYPRRI